MIDLEILREILSGVKTEHRNSLEASSIINEVWKEVLEYSEPERKKGKWIGKEQFANSPDFYSWQCSVCGCVLEDPTMDKPYPFCPSCGADMRGE